MITLTTITITIIIVLKIMAAIFQYMAEREAEWAPAWSPLA